MKEYELGVNTYQLAEKYQCNPSTVQDRLKSMFCEMRGRVEIDIIKLQKEYESGLSTIELGNKYGCAHATIRNKLKHAGYKLRKKGVYKKLINVNIEVLIKEYESGLSTIELGNKYGCSSTTILRTLKNNKCFMRSKKENSNKQWDDPKARENASEMTKKQFKDQKARENASEKQKQMWKNPEYREKQVLVQKQKYDDPEYREKMCDVHKNQYINNPELSKKLSIIHKKRYVDNPELRILNSCSQLGISRDEWDGFAKENPYCEKFNESCRERNRARYGRKCFICGKPESENFTKTGKPQRLSVHHIDRNKQQGCDDYNWALVPLCLKHHGESHSELWEARITWLLDNVWE